jgi:hypothetical protein
MEELPDDIDALPVFEAWQWIGIGKKYVMSKIPLHVHIEKEQQLIIPDMNLAHFPAINLPITKFMELSLPLQSTEIITTNSRMP